MKVVQMSSLADDIKEITGAYKDSAHKDATYPYAVFELDRIDSDSGDTYILEINVWDSNRSYNRVDNVALALEKKLHGYVENNPYRTFTVHKGTMKHILDDDKSIKRTQLQLTVTSYEKEDINENI